MLDTRSTTKNEHWIEALGIKRSKIPILIVGNNPIEMTSIYNVLTGIRSKSYLADFCFDVKDCFNKISNTKPEIIFIDDNMILDDINKMIRVLKQNPKTKNIKIIALKSSNWNYSVIDKVDDYILKDVINAEIMEKIITKNLLPAEKILV